MKTIPFALLAAITATPLFAQDTRALEAHEHGVSTLELALEGPVLALHLRAPGMDIVGFEYQPRADGDKDAVADAIRDLLVPETLVTLPKAAGCRLAKASAHLETGAQDAHDDHEGDGGHDAHEDHEDHSDHADHEDHSDHDDHADHADHGADEDHADAPRHSAFHAQYEFDCATPEALTSLKFAFFERFETAREIEVSYVTMTGAGLAEITKDAPDLELN